MTPAEMLSRKKHPGMSGLRQLRLRYGLSIVDVAEGAGIHKTQYYEIEATMRGCGPLNARRLAEFYGLTEKAIRLLATTSAVTQITTTHDVHLSVASGDGDLQPLPDADEVSPVPSR